MGDESPEDLDRRLTPLQHRVTQREGTEPPFDNEYWNEHREGIYVDIVSGEPLFSSHDKYDSGTGWPSFTKPICPDAVATKTDHTLPLPRTEVVKKLWAYIKKNGLQDQKNKRNINADATLKEIFGRSTVNMFEMTKLVGKHLS